MPRRRQPEAGAAEPASPSPMPPFVIDPNGVYLAEQIRAALRLRASSLKSEWRRGRLRVVRRCGRNFYLGRDLLAWLDSGELPAPSRRPQPGERERPRREHLVARA